MPEAPLELGKRSTKPSPGLGKGPFGLNAKRRLYSMR